VTQDKRQRWAAADSRTGNVRATKQWGAFVQPLLQWKTNKYYIFRLCVCNAHALYCRLWPAWQQYFPILSHKRHKFRIKKKVIEIKCVLIFFTTFFRDLSISKKNSAIWSKLYIGLHIKHPFFFSEFSETCIFATNFRYIHKYQISRKSVQLEPSCSMRTDGWADWQTWRNSHSFAILRRRLKNYTLCSITDEAFLNPLNPELNPICYLLALLGAHHFLHVSRIRVRLLTFRLLMSYIYIWSTHSWCF